MSDFAAVGGSAESFSAADLHSITPVPVELDAMLELWLAHILLY